MGTVGIPRDCQNFLATPIISGMGKATDFKFLYAHSYGRSEQKPTKNFEKSSRERSQGVPKIFRAPIARSYLQ